MYVRHLIAALVLGLVAGLAAADDRLVRLFAPQALIETGLIKYAMPRFSLKTQVRVEIVGDPSAADMVLGGDGRALFEGAGAVWHMNVQSQQDRGTKRLADWLTSDIGLRTITSFAPNGTALFRPPSERQAERVEVSFDGDPAQGRDVSRTRCARCHVVDEATRKTSIGSTPSFFVLRALGDWEERFAAFYALNPHPAFTQIEDVTPPFPIDRPSPIHPVTMTIEEIEAVLAYVAVLTPADLGAPLGIGSDF